MRLPTLLNDRAYELDSSESESRARSNRRNFLRTLGLVGVGMALAPTDVIASPLKSLLSPTPTPAALLASREEWRIRVKRFVNIVAQGDPATARWINSRLDDSEIDEASYQSGFHYRFSPRHIFNRKIDLKEVICGNGFMVDLFPYYGVDCTCPSDYDLNAVEMRRLTNALEMDYYGCVLAPAGPREETDYSDHADYQKLRATNYPNHRREDWSLEYKRPVVSVKNNKKYMAYGIEHKTETDALGKPTGDVLITPYEV